jgi:hypothetical protein
MRHQTTNCLNKEDIISYLFQDLEIAPFIDTLNYAIFCMAVSNDDNLSEQETRQHLFTLRELIDVLTELNKERKN